MTIYISGPMTKIKDNNIQAFGRAHEQLKGKGHLVVNPHDLSEKVNVDAFYNGQLAEYSDYMRSDIIQMLLYCDTIFMLDGWRESKGAKLELAVAIACGLQVFFNIDEIPVAK